MPNIETKSHDIKPGKEQDVIIKVGNFRLYFQNYYNIISLANDLLTGGLYLSGSLVQAFTNLERIGMYLYIFASFFLLMRPVIRIVHHVFLYRENEYREQVLGESPEEYGHDTGTDNKAANEIKVESNEEAEEDDEDSEEKEA
ncbi:YrhK family protein [Marinilactibacillus kalidii]|uniref:YrhK family protein n=1 Tax=Marinilactibacillus kalidii TaxID=2820274 RepID=UPI001ABE448F|nr:YrhK family protein [Marinilactibacillus kalidii]